MIKLVKLPSETQSGTTEVGVHGLLYSQLKVFTGSPSVNLKKHIDKIKVGLSGC